MKTENPPVLDACCGARTMWFNHEDWRAIYMDRRVETYIVDRGTPMTKGRNPVVVGFFSTPKDSSTSTTAKQIAWATATVMDPALRTIELGLREDHIVVWRVQVVPTPTPAPPPPEAVSQP